MRSLESWFSEYSESHQNPQNRLIHKVCVPLIFFAVVGLLLQIPVHLGPLKLGELFVAIALGWSFTLGAKPFVVMLGQLLICYIMPSFFKDLQFLLIGPLWVVKDLFFK